MSVFRETQNAISGVIDDAKALYKRRQLEISRSKRINLPI